MEARDTKPRNPIIMPETYNTRFIDRSNALERFVENALRRAIDVVVAFWGLLVLSPLFLYIALRLKQDSPGPVFYRGPRVGYKGKPFGILKFRTMYEDENSYQGSRVTANGDSRVTPFGKFLRDTKFNELPQLWNVLVGEMSLVGPRPEDPTIAAEWPKEVQELIFSVRPGVTSPASVIYRSEEQMLDGSDPLQQYFQSVLPSKLRLDQLYVRNRNLLTDIDVIFWTAIALLPKLRDRQIGETRLFWGPIATFISRFLSWFVIDTIMAFTAALLSELIWRSSFPLNLGAGRAVLVALMFGLLFSLINALLGLNRVTWSRAAAGDAFTLAFSVLVTTGILVFLKLNFLESEILPVGVIITTGVFSLMGFVFVRYRERLVTGAASRWIRARDHARTIAERVLIIGAGDNGEMALWMMNRPSLARAFAVVGFVDDNPRKQGTRVNGVEVIGTSAMLGDLVRQRDVGLIVYTIHNVDPRRRLGLIKAAHGTGVRTVVLPDMMAQLAKPDCQAEQLLEDHPLGQPLTQAEMNQILQHIAHLAHQGDLDGVQMVTDQLINLLPVEGEDSE